MYNGHNDLKLKDIALTSHSTDRARERLNITTKDYNTILGRVRNELKLAKYIGVILDDEGKESHLYSYNNIGYYLTMDKKKVATIMIHNKISYAPLKKNMIELHKKEIRKLTRAEVARLKRFDEFKLKMQMEVSALEYKIHRSRSKRAKNTYMNMIDQWNQQHKELEDEIVNIKKEKRRVSRSLVALI